MDAKARLDSIVAKLGDLATKAEDLGIELINIVTALDEADDTYEKASQQKPAWRPSWYLIAKRYVGHVKEIAGKASNPVISEMWISIGWSPQPDAVAWCAVFINHVLDLAGYVGTNSPRARSFEVYGEAVLLADIQVGDLVVLKRGTNPALGHVTLFDGFIDKLRFYGLGGNQRDSVCISSYAIADIVAIRRPTKGDADCEEDNG